MRNATPVFPFKTRRPTHRHYFLRVNFRPFSFFTRTTRDKINPGHTVVTSVVRATGQVNGRRQTYPSHTPTPLNRQSPNIAHVITPTISPHKRHLVKISPGVTSPHIAKVTTQFF